MADARREAKAEPAGHAALGSDCRLQEPEKRALRAFIYIARTADYLNGRLALQLEERGLSLGQYWALHQLFFRGSMHQKEMGERLYRSGGNMSLVVDNLEKRDLVRRERTGEDRRAVKVHLTPAGESLVREMLPRNLAAIVAEMKALGAAEQTELMRLCKKLGRLDDDGCPCR